MRILISLILLALSSISWAGAPVCHVHAPGNYCQYSGKVSRIYVNDEATSMILIYFDTPIDTADAVAVGFNAVHGEAAGFQISDNPDFAKLFYSTVLAAQASGRSITMQMRGTVNGYLKFDRIWLNAP